jgi:hypothetical protein
MSDEATSLINFVYGQRTVAASFACGARSVPGVAARREWSDSGTPESPTAAVGGEAPKYSFNSLLN